MLIHTDPQSVQQLTRQWRANAEHIAFVPTMGNLHHGHLTLIEKAKEISDKVVVSIFVNPMQFDRSEDFDSYPRTPKDDLEKLEQAGVDVVFMPTDRDIYPDGFEKSSSVYVPHLSDVLEGALRPGHFKGVATVVTKLFNIVTPDVACFGEKDFQQLALIRKLTADLMLPITIQSVPVIRYEDGLAMSSRNRFLTPAERDIAPQLTRTLRQMGQQLQHGESAVTVREMGIQQLTHTGFRVDSLDIMDARTLTEINQHSQQAVILASAYLGIPRLIDNWVVELSPSI
ncbi:pantoate--beta-alanine ligase [Celerinatantimonas sp. YJH-8]|uniref:pantoate--beta-alanine ligase n=1 Tax=Celerinatantimonas sp. YJH-8 TaxID=3228714 RepID=UPI0038C6AF2B